MDLQSFQLKVQSGPSTGETFVIIKVETSIGRDDKNDVAVHDATVSRKHAVIVVQGTHYVLQDLGSTNGTYINDARLNAPQVLKPNDVILFGDNVRMLFEPAEDDPYATLHGVRTAGSVSAQAPHAAGGARTQQMTRGQVDQAMRSGKPSVSEVGEAKSLTGLASVDAQEMGEGSYGMTMSKSQEANLAFNLDEDTDLWPAMLTGFIASNGEKSEELKYGFVNNSEAWAAFYNEVKEKDMINAMAPIARDKLIRWSIIIKNVLADLGHTRLFRMYLQALMAQKIKKIVGVGGRANLKKQINAILAVIASNMMANLDKYEEAQMCLTTGRAKDGSALSDTLKKFYDPSRAENLKQITLLLGVIIIFRAAANADDIKRLQDFIRINLIAPLKSEADAMPTGYDKTQANKRIEGYMQLIKTVDISFG